jgi:hypothetical protein
MKTFLLFITPSFVLTACQRELGSKYQYQVPKRMRTAHNEGSSFFEFNHDDATFSHYKSSRQDALYGSYVVVGNQLYLTELGRFFRCDTILQIESAAYIFLHKFNSLPAVNWPVEINGEMYYTDSAGVLENYKHTDTATFILIRPVLLKAFRLPSNCKQVIFSTEPLQVNNPDFLEYTIRRKIIRSKDGYTYKKGQLATKIRN